MEFDIEYYPNSKPGDINRVLSVTPKPLIIFGQKIDNKFDKDYKPILKSFRRHKII